MRWTDPAKAGRAPLLSTAKAAVVVGSRVRFARRPRKPKKDGTPRAKPRELEHKEQVIVAEWLDRAGILYCAVPNGGQRHPGVARKLSEEGVKPGVPDLLIFERPPHADARGVAVEMKQADGGRVSNAQAEWHAALIAQGWIVVVAHGAAEALKALNALGYRVPG